MNQVIINFFQYFGQVTRIDVSPFIDSIYFNWGTLGIGLILCFFGYKIHRIIFSLIMLMITILTISTLFKDANEWRYVVTSFSIFSVVIAFMAYFWRRIATILFVGLIVTGFAIVLNVQIEFAFILGIMFGMCAYYVPFIALVIATSIFGSIVASELINLTLAQVNSLVLTIGLVMFGFIFQIMTNKVEMDKLVRKGGAQHG